MNIVPTGKISHYSEENSCISCHTDMKGFTPQHQNVSCVSCHLGSGTDFDKTSAHRNMINIPGNLSNAANTCSSTACHPGINHRVNNSLMNTMSGIISVDKYVFGEHDNLDSLFDVHHIGFSKAELHLRDKCASCHLGNEKTEYTPITEMSRGGGCLACHLNYDSQAKQSLDMYLDLDELPKIHPQISLAVTDNHCFGCHSRSGRISTNYEGWHETLLKDKSLANQAQYRLLEDQRIFEKKEADIHHTLGMSCIDCHDTWDVMGDGLLHTHKEEAVTTHCTDCHDAGAVHSTKFTNLDVASQRMIQNRGFDTTYNFLISPFYQKQLTNVILKNDNKYMLGKNNHQEYLLSTPSEYCTNPIHEDVSCSTCHTAWAPQCISCHTEFKSDAEAYDLLAKKSTKGKWLEIGGHYFAGYPTLGIFNNTINTFTPGMIMTLKNNEKDSSFVRLFAPSSAHTIAKKGNSCKTCHNNPVALGYGRGELVFSPRGTWTFKPQFDKSEDGLPMDAWIEFLVTDTVNKATRTNARPFTFEEQRTMLEVGACLTCHQDNSKVIASMLVDYPKTLKSVSSDCILPIIKPKQ